MLPSAWRLDVALVIDILTRLCCCILRSLRKYDRAMDLLETVQATRRSRMPLTWSIIVSTSRLPDSRITMSCRYRYGSLLTQPKIAGLYRLQLELRIMVDISRGVMVSRRQCSVFICTSSCIHPYPKYPVNSLLSALGRVPWSRLLQGNEVSSSPFRLLEAV